MKKWFLGVLTLTLLSGVFFLMLQNAEQDTISNTTTWSVPENNNQLATNTVSNSQTSAVRPTHDDSPEKLALIVTSQNQSQESRKKALYNLTTWGTAALESLNKIATAPIANSLTENQKNFEIELRVTAIESLDEIAIDPNYRLAVKECMLKILENHEAQSLTLLAQISMSGIESGQPGKVKRAIDTLFNDSK